MEQTNLFQCSECRRLFDAMWGDICNQCRTEEKRHREIIAANKCTKCDSLQKRCAELEEMNKNQRVYFDENMSLKPKLKIAVEALKYIAQDGLDHVNIDDPYVTEAIKTLKKLGEL